MIATITLNPSIDQHIQVKKLVKDDANRADSIFEYPGGKGVNVSKVIRELGGDTVAYALTGGLTGRRLEELVRRLDFPFRGFSIRGSTRVNTIITDTQDRTQTRISAPGPVVPPRDLSRFLGRLVADKPKPVFWALGGSPPHRAPASVYKKIILALQAHGTPCILDTDGDALRHGVEARPFMIKPNEFEMERLIGRRLKTLRDTRSAAEQLVKKGVSIVIVSLAEKGALFSTKAGSFHVSTPKVEVKSNVGAGDSLIGGVVFALSKKRTLETAAKLGIAASTSAVMREAPRLCLRSDISGLLPRIHIRHL